MKVDDQRPPKLFIPKDILAAKISMDYSQDFDFLVGSANLLAKPRRQLHICCAFASPAHDEHMANLASPVKKVDFCQIYRSQKHRHGRRLSLAQDLIYLRLAGDFLP